MKVISAEQLIEKLDVNVYAITLVKFLLNKRKIMYYFNKAADSKFEIRGVQYKVNHEECKDCNDKKAEGILCRQHTSLNRILSATKVLYDLDTSVYMYKNEIFRMIDKRLVIIYCPHPSLIIAPVTDEKLRRIKPITIEDPDFTKLPEYNSVHILTNDLIDQHVKCWFNSEFSLMTLPEDRNLANWCLVPNR